MRKDFIDAIAKTLKTERRDLVEKDLVLQQALIDLSGDEFFSGNFAFKGGTCLIKSYLGYYRFSEDIDFTWRRQEAFKGMSQKEVRRYLSPVINKVGGLFEGIAGQRNMDFKASKGDRDYVELGGGNKTATMKVWYNSETLGRRSFFKVQVNFVEDLRYPIVRREIKGMVGVEEELHALFPEEYEEYTRRVSLDAYDIREIMCEKVRSILTRRGVKARDFVDVYLITKRLGVKTSEVEENIVDKTRFTLELYERYRRNLAEKKKLLDSGRIFGWGDEKSLLLIDIDEKDFYDFLDGFTESLKNIAGKISA